jgi:hypothetical protein
MCRFAQATTHRIAADPVAHVPDHRVQIAAKWSLLTVREVRLASGLDGKMVS